MTREELKDVFGGQMKELKPIIIRPEKVNTFKFSGFAVSSTVATQYLLRNLKTVKFKYAEKNNQ